MTIVSEGDPSSQSDGSDSDTVIEVNDGDSNATSLKVDAISSLD